MYMYSRVALYYAAIEVQLEQNTLVFCSTHFRGYSASDRYPTAAILVVVVIGLQVVEATFLGE